MTQGGPSAQCGLVLIPLSGHDDLVDQVFAPKNQGLWAAFALHDPAAELYFVEPHFTACRDTVFAVMVPERPDIVMARWKHLNA